MLHIKNFNEFVNEAARPNDANLLRQQYATAFENINACLRDEFMENTFNARTPNWEIFWTADYDDEVSFNYTVALELLLDETKMVCAGVIGVDGDESTLKEIGLKLTYSQRKQAYTGNGSICTIVDKKKFGEWLTAQLGGSFAVQPDECTFVNGNVQVKIVGEDKFDVTSISVLYNPTNYNYLNNVYECDNEEHDSIGEYSCNAEFIEQLIAAGVKPNAFERDAIRCYKKVAKELWRAIKTGIFKYLNENNPNRRRYV